MVTDTHAARGRRLMLAMCLVLVVGGLRGASGQAAEEDPAHALLVAVSDRFGEQGVLSVLDVVFRRPNGNEEEYRFEIWRRIEESRERLAILVREPELERGIGFLIDRPVGVDGEGVSRHMYLPTLGRVRRVRGAGNSRLERRLGGLLGPTLIRVGPQTQALTRGTEPCGEITCRRIEATSKTAGRAEIWLEEVDDPVVRRAILRESRGRPKQILEIDSVDEVGGRRVEASGSITVPGRSVTRFQLHEIRLLEPSEEGPFTLESFSARAELLAGGAGRDP